MSCLMYTAVLTALTMPAAAISARPRLRERDLDMQLMGRKLPIDPDGSDGAKRVAGFFALNRTEVGNRSAANARPSQSPAARACL